MIHPIIAIDGEFTIDFDETIKDIVEINESCHLPINDNDTPTKINSIYLYSSMIYKKY